MSFINGEDVSDEIEEVDATTNGSNNAIFMTRTGVDTVRMLLYKDQLAYVFTVTRRGEILDFIINLENSLRGETKGLFGNFNGDTTDDYIKPNGIQVSSDASDQMLHDYGQSCEWLYSYGGTPLSLHQIKEYAMSSLIYSGVELHAGVFLIIAVCSYFNTCRANN